MNENTNENRVDCPKVRNRRIELFISLIGIILIVWGTYLVLTKEKIEKENPDTSENITLTCIQDSVEQHQSYCCLSSNGTLNDNNCDKTGASFDEANYNECIPPKETQEKIQYIFVFNPEGNMETVRANMTMKYLDDIDEEEYERFITECDDMQEAYSEAIECGVAKGDGEIELDALITVSKLPKSLIESEPGLGDMVRMTYDETKNQYKEMGFICN